MTEEGKIILEELKAAGYGPFVSKKEYAQIVGCSLSTINNYISKGYGVPAYKKLGLQKNSKVFFALVDVAEYLASQTIRTA